MTEWGCNRSRAREMVDERRRGALRAPLDLGRRALGERPYEGNPPGCRKPENVSGWTSVTAPSVPSLLQAARDGATADDGIVIVDDCSLTGGAGSLELVECDAD